MSLLYLAACSERPGVPKITKSASVATACKMERISGYSEKADILRKINVRGGLFKRRLALILD